MPSLMDQCLNRDDGNPNTEQTSYFGKIKNSFMGAFIGIILIIGMFALLGWNEGRAVKRARDLEEAEGLTVEAECFNVDPSLQGKVIHIICPTDSVSNLTDTFFGLSGEGHFLTRTVEMYQDIESSSTRKNSVGGGSTKTYSYRRGWSTRPQRISNSNHPQNPAFAAAFSKNPQRFSAPIQLGDYILDGAILDKIGSTSPKNITAITPPVGYTEPSLGFSNQQGILSTVRSTPQIGDYRAELEVDYVGTVSAVAELQGNRLVGKQGSSGSTVLLVARTAKSADEMFQQAEDENEATTWILRFVGFGLMWLGWTMFLSPWTVFVDIIPWAGPYLGSCLQGVVCCVTFPIALGLSLITIAIAWLIYRPVIGIPLLIVGLLLLGGVWYWRKKKSKQQPQNGGPPSGQPMQPMGQPQWGPQGQQWGGQPGQPMGQPGQPQWQQPPQQQWQQPPQQGGPPVAQPVGQQQPWPQQQQPQQGIYPDIPVAQPIDSKA